MVHSIEIFLSRTFKFRDPSLSGPGNLGSGNYRWWRPLGIRRQIGGQWLSPFTSTSWSLDMTWAAPMLAAGWPLGQAGVDRGCPVPHPEAKRGSCTPLIMTLMACLLAVSRVRPFHNLLSLHLWRKGLASCKGGHAKKTRYSSTLAGGQAGRFGLSAGAGAEPRLRLATSSGTEPDPSTIHLSCRSLE